MDPQKLILAGDFLQLPPVWKHRYRPPKFAFEARSWYRCVGRAIFLTKVFRQRDEGQTLVALFPDISFDILLAEFIGMLNSVRVAKIDRDVVNFLKSLQRKVVYDDGLEPTDV